MDLIGYPGLPSEVSQAPSESSLLFLTTVICAGEVWRSSRALGHQDQPAHHRSLRYDQRFAQGNNLLGKVTVLTWLVSI